MTPPAMTPAGRSSTTDRKARKQTSPRIPRRVSGPVGGRAGGATIPRPSRPATPGPAKPGSARPAPPRRRRRQQAASRTVAGAGLLARTGAFIRALPDHSLLDRIVRGRAWIPLLGVLLAGIVAMQVEVLKLGASIGRSLERSTALEGRNELLRANVAGLADDQRIERLAAKMGMIMPGPDQVGFLAGGANGSLDRALANIHAPDPGNFASSSGVVTAASAMASTGTAPTPSSASASTGSSASASTQATNSVQTTTTSSATSASGG